MPNPYVHDQLIGKHVKREYFSLNENRYCKNTDLITNLEWFSMRTNKGWQNVESSIDIELAYETRFSRRLIWRLFLFASLPNTIFILLYNNINIVFFF